MSARAQRHDARHALAALGVAGPAAFTLVLLVLGALRPGYDHARDVMSRLGEVGYPLGWAMNLFGFALLGVTTLGFAEALRRAFEGPAARAGALCVALAGGGLLALAVVPCDPGCVETGPLSRWHSPTASFTAGMMGLALLAFAWDSARRPGWSGHAMLTLACLVLAGAFGALYNLRVEPWIGAWQRLALAGPLLWSAATGLRLLRAPRGSSPSP